MSVTKMLQNHTLRTLRLEIGRLNLEAGAAKAQGDHARYCELRRLMLNKQAELYQTKHEREAA